MTLQSQGGQMHKAGSHRGQEQSREQRTGGSGGLQANCASIGARQTAENCTRVLPLQSHTQAVKQMLGCYAWVLAGLGG